MSQASDAAVAELRVLRPDLDAADAELVAWAALSVMGSVPDHRVRLPRTAFEELLAGIAMDAVSVEFGGEVAGEDNRPEESGTQDRKEQILAAAARLFWDRGYHEVTLDEIGAAAGIAGPSVYSHFAGKTELLRTITERIGERLRHDLAESDAAAKVRADGVRELSASSASVSEPVPTTPSLTTPSLTATAAIAALADLATRYVTTVLSSRDLVAAYFTEGHNLPDRDRAETRRFQRAYTAHWSGTSRDRESRRLARGDPHPRPGRVRRRQ